jgi:type IV pilus assembly protein PilO
MSSKFRFENLQRSTQMTILGIVVVAAAAFFYIYYLDARLNKLKIIQKDIVKLQLSVSQGTAIESRLKRFMRELAELEERLVVLRSILPSEKETPTVLRNVQVMATSSNLKIQKFTPQPVVPKNFYSDWPIKIEVEGNYDGLGVFFEKVSQATRIIDVGSIFIEGLDKQPEKSKTLRASCTATTFVFREDQESNQPTEKTKAKKKGVKR